MADRREIGGWHLRGKLRRSVNAMIWNVTKDGESRLVMKVPRQQSRQEGNYKRFEREVQILTQLQGMPGVMEVVDSRLPGDPSEANPAYYVMPKMRPVSKILRSVGLDDALAGVLQVTRVLAELAEKDITHRDIKPDNLFVHGGHWVVGDFGLVKAPHFTTITETGRKIGPTWYIAPELVNPQAEPDYAAADVYSVAKLLWVLVAGMTFPLPGPHLSFPQWAADLYSVVSYGVPSRRARMLDSLLQRGTHGVPHERPTMRSFADELEKILHWKESATEVSAPDLSELVTRIAAAVQPDVDVAELRRLRTSQLGELASQSLVPALEPIYRRLCGTQARHMNVALGENNQLPACYCLSQGVDPIVAARGVAVEVRLTARDFPRLLCGFLVHVRQDGSLCLQAGHHLAVPESEGPDFFKWDTVWSDYLEVPYGSVEQYQAISRSSQELSDRLNGAMQRFTELVEKCED